MLVFLFIDILIANEGVAQEAIPVPSASQTTVEDLLPQESSIKIKPFFLEGSVDNFDPIKRAKSLSKTISRKWCGNYQPFNEEKNFPVTILFNKLQPKRQIISIEGEMILDNKKILLAGILNAKSDQLELIPLLEKPLQGLEPGGYFVGLQGVNLFTWKASKLDQYGGRLELSNQCLVNSSKTLPIKTSW